MPISPVVFACLLAFGLASRVSHVQRSALKKCNPWSDAWTKYGSRVLSNVAGCGGAEADEDNRCPFWHVCLRRADGTCPDDCEDSSGWIPRFCKKPCVYKESAMLEYTVQPKFLATSLAMLEAKDEKQGAKCSGLLPIFQGCQRRQQKIGKLFSFVVKAGLRAAKMAQQGDVAGCQHRMPLALGRRLSHFVSKFSQQLEDTQMVPDNHAELLVKLAKVYSMEDFCQGASRIANEMQHANETLLKEGTTKALEDNGMTLASASQAADRALQAAHSGDDVELALAQDLHQVEKSIDHYGQHASSLVSLSEEDEDADQHTLSATPSMALASRGFLKGIVRGFWAFLVHSIVGTIYGAFIGTLWGVGLWWTAAGESPSGIILGLGFIIYTPLASLYEGWFEGVPTNVVDEGGHKIDLTPTRPLMRLYQKLGVSWELVGDEFESRLPPGWSARRARDWMHGGSNSIIPGGRYYEHKATGVWQEERPTQIYMLEERQCMPEPNGVPIGRNIIHTCDEPEIDADSPDGFCKPMTFQTFEYRNEFQYESNWNDEKYEAKEKKWYKVLEKYWDSKCKLVKS